MRILQQNEPSRSNWLNLTTNLLDPPSEYCPCCKHHSLCRARFVSTCETTVSDTRYECIDCGFITTRKSNNQYVDEVTT